ncbi:MAG: hypothetical protein LBB20_03585 [Puniceicoccales bacterium]|jgi:hypothetical protein|nr:hypothetical protein [Puniceicoccales bacterium]
MNNRFINKGMLAALILCSATVMFLSALGTLVLRQKIFIHAGIVNSLESECRRIEDKNLSLVSKIAQMQTPNYLRIRLGNDISVPKKEQIIHVTNWDKSRPDKDSAKITIDNNTPEYTFTAKI